MKIFMCSLIIWGMVLMCPQYFNVDGQEKGRPQIPATFTYPDSPITVEIEKPLSARSLSGKVVDAAGFALPEVLVERVTSDWEKRIDATLTDSEGAFDLSCSSKGKFYLRLSKPGFNRVLVKVKVNKKSQDDLKLRLEPST